MDIPEFATSVKDAGISRIPEAGLECMAINDYITSISTVTAVGEAVPESSIGSIATPLQRKIGMYAYLRDEYGAETLADALRILRESKVNPGVISLWIEDELAVNGLEFDAIAQGYPDRIGELRTASDRFMARMLQSLEL